jgi:hypothetical protein
MFRNISPTIKSILFLAGAFTFAFLLGEMTHEFGHYLTHLVFDTPDVGVHLDPFGGSRIIGVTSFPDAAVAGITSAAGPLLNLALGITAFLGLWRLRRPFLLPLMLWGPVSMIQEGVTFSLGLLTPGGDAQWIVSSGVPAMIVLVWGIVFLFIGVCTIALLLPLAGVGDRYSIRRKFAIVLMGMGSLMLLRAVHSVLASPVSAMENLIPLVFSILLAVMVVWLNEPVVSMIGEDPPSPLPEVSWSPLVSAFVLGVSIFIFQIYAH